MSTATLTAPYDFQKAVDAFDTGFNRDWLILMYDKAGMDLRDIAMATEATLRDVMETLDCEHICEECGRPADLALGHKAFVLVEGDRDMAIHSTKCCEGFFVNRAGNEVLSGLWEGGE